MDRQHLERIQRVLLPGALPCWSTWAGQCLSVWGGGRRQRVMTEATLCSAPILHHNLCGQRLVQSYHQPQEEYVATSPLDFANEDAEAQRG